MGNLQSLLIGSAVSTSYKYAYKQYQRYLPVEDEYVEWIEEHCVDLENPMKLLGGKHSFLVITTISGRKIRYDFSADNPEGSIIYEYSDWFPCELFRKAAVPPGIKVKDITSVFKKIAKTHTYNIKTHNCQHVARDTYNEISLAANQALRNNHLKWFYKALPADYHGNIKYNDPEHDEIEEKAVIRPKRRKLTPEEKKEKAENRHLFDFPGENATEEEIMEYLREIARTFGGTVNEKILDINENK
ncbi:unnamed protein product [Blepharisma stoltei]|uniref:LRAT domain-containing protein n=1 Tax=Blepharisma stoltei TaxID=1481888 RepID=A0AAU9JBJ9_9CILI|nr:unnamed protein product [Blepharisma stoltei]